MASGNGGSGDHFGRRYLPGLGDVLVVAAILVLVWFSVAPHVTGRSLAATETYARVTLHELQGAARDAGLFEALDTLQKDAVVQCGVRPFGDYEKGAPARQFFPTWEDDGYYYRLNLHPEVAAKTLVDAIPQRLRLTGWLGFRATPTGQVHEVTLANRGASDTSAATTNEARARETTARLARRAESLAIPAALAKLARLWPAELRLAGPAGGSELAFGRTAFPMWTSDSVPYRFCAWPVAGAAPASLDLELLAWPKEAGVSGYAAFRLTRAKLGMQQSRNLVRTYGGSKPGDWPLPGAGHIRTGARPDPSGGYTGVDANRWFPIRHQ